jgi:hypothetical protein
MSDPVSKSTDALVETNVPAEITPPLFGKQDPTENRSHVPAATRALLGKPPLLVTKDPNEYGALLDALAREVRPGTPFSGCGLRKSPISPGRSFAIAASGPAIRNTNSSRRLGSAAYLASNVVTLQRRTGAPIWRSLRRTAKLRR